jgi:sepiapterin reductase
MSPPSSSVTAVITGASRGFGRAMAQIAAETFGDVRLVLVARSAKGLQETSESVKKDVPTSCHAMDLSNLDQLDANLDVICRELEGCERLIFINNAGTIGHLGPCIDSPSFQDMRANVDLNITSCLWTSVKLAKYANAHGIDATIVNISSLMAVADLPTFGIYSAGKVARDKYHTLLAKETPSVTTLNYAPGPLETDMVTKIRNAETLDSNLKPNFEQQVLDPLDSARKLFRLLDSKDFESGAHIDYYDLPDVD